MRQIALGLIFSFALAGVHPAQAQPAHGLSMYGELKYPANFKHFDYVNPAAPHGGTVKLSAIGTYDSLNPFIIRGTPAAGITLIYNSLMAASLDEPFAQYGELAESVETPEDRSSVTYKLRDNARWHDGVEVTADDVVFTFNMLKTKGSPFYRQYYTNVAKVEKLGPKTVRFDFSGPKNRELPLIVGQLTILPKHYWANRNFESASLDPPLGSGPYKVDQVQPGRSISYTRVKNYWGNDIPTQKGMYNFATIHFDYYRDPSIAFQAFKSGTFDYRNENSSKRWATGYNIEAVKKGQIIKASLPNSSTRGAQGFVFNTRRPLFKDRMVRAALQYTFDFEWANKHLFYGLYKRNRSYFDNGELAATGLPSADELKLLNPLKSELPPEVFTKAYEPPSTKGRDGIRANLRIAQRMLHKAGWVVKNNQLVNAKTGQPFEFEILILQQDFERIIAPMVANMKRLGIVAHTKLVDTSQYVNRLRDKDFDMVIASFGQSDSPGNEQRFYWGSGSANQPGSRNLAGISSPAIDKLINYVIYADSRHQLVTAVHALDRALQWGYYMIPQMINGNDWIAYWNRFERPQQKPKFDVGFLQTWWIDPAKDAALTGVLGRK